MRDTSLFYCSLCINIDCWPYMFVCVCVCIAQGMFTLSDNMFVHARNTLARVRALLLSDVMWIV